MLHTFYTLQAVKGQRTLEKSIVRAATRERVLATYPNTVYAIDVTPYLIGHKAKRGYGLVALTINVLGEEVVLGLYGRRTDILRDYPANIVQSGLVASHPRVRRELQRSMR